MAVMARPRILRPSVVAGGICLLGLGALIAASTTEAPLLGLAITAFVVTLGAALVDIDVGFGIFVFAAGFGRGLDIGAAAGLVLAFVLVRPRAARVRSDQLLLPGFALAFMSIGIASWVYNGFPATSVGAWLLPMAMRIGLIAVLVLYCNSARRRLAAVAGLLCAAAVQGGFGLAQSLGYVATDAVAWLPSGDEVVRVGGLEGEPTFYALNLAVAVGFALAAWRRGWALALAGAVLVLGLGGIVVSLTRTAVIAVAAIGLFAILESLLRLRVGRGRLLALIAIGALTLVWIDPKILLSRFEDVRRISSTQIVNSSTGQRFILIKSSYKLFRSSPLLGVGPDQTKHKIGEVAPTTLQLGQSAHNTFLDIAADLGILGIALWLLLLFFSLKRGLRLRHKMPGRNGAVLDGAVLALVGFIAGSLFLTAVLTSIFWISIGLISSFSEQEPAPGT